MGRFQPVYVFCIAVMCHVALIQIIYGWERSRIILRICGAKGVIHRCEKSWVASILAQNSRRPMSGLFWIRP